MLSIVICSINPIFLQQVEKSIADTIGNIAYEILSVDNRNTSKGISEVYNSLAEKANYEFICFLHEDVLFNTSCWGEKLVAIFSNDITIGMVGVAGSKYKSKLYSGWYTGVKELDCANIIHRFEYGDEQLFLAPVNYQSAEEVVCIDGVFIVCKKNVWAAAPFNETALIGFHFYDIDFSLKAAEKYKIIVTYDIELIHITKGGDFSNAWVETTIDYHQNINKNLPTSKIEIDIKATDFSVAKGWLDWLKNYNISFSNKIKWVFSQQLHIRPSLYYSIAKFMLYKSLRLKSIHQLFKRK